MRKTFLDYSRQMLRWTTEFIPAEPHQELQPWCGWFRPISCRKAEWLRAWPHEDWLHP